jgi:hypothetical protein
MWLSAIPYALVLLGLFYMARRGIRAFERSNGIPADVTALGEEMHKLREALWAMTNTVEQLREEQEFAKQLRADTPQETAPLSPAPRPALPL